MLPRLLRLNRPWIWLLLLLVLYNAAGFLLVPWIAERQLVAIAAERLQLDAHVERIRFNPWSWRLAADDLQIREADGQQLIGFRALNVDLEFWSSLRSRAVVLAFLEIDGLGAYLEQIDADQTNIGRLGQRWQVSAPPETTVQEPVSSGDGIGVIMRRLSIRDSSVDIVDRVPATDFVFAIRPINLQLDNVTTLPGESLSLQSTMQFARGGTLELSGDLAWQPQLDARFQFLVSELALDWLNPYLEPYADVQIDDGHVRLEGSVSATTVEPVQANLDVTIDDLRVVHDDAAIAAWERLEIPQVRYSLTERSIETGSIILTRPSTALTIFPEGDTNLSRLIVPGNTAEAAPTPPAEGQPDDPSTDGRPESADEPALTYAIAGVSVIDAALDFTDLALPLPFEAEIRDFNGSVSAVSNATREPATLELEGRVGEFGAVTASGELLPLGWQDMTRIDLAFRNVSLPETSPYLIKFAGRTIDSGKLDLDLGYHIESGELQGDNHMVLREFRLGERVDHPGAMSLPLDLAIALLKDRDGVIDVELPVSGQLGDPQFSYGGVVRKALVNLITGIATAPFRFLANLFGDDQPLGQVRFAPGRAELAPPERETLGKLAEALVQRPQLVLQVPAPYRPDLDRAALQQSRFAEQLEAEIARLSGTTPEAGAAANRRAALETIYRARALEPAPESLALQYSETDAETGATSFDAIGYAAELERRLVASEPVTETELRSLAQARAAAVSGALSALDPGLAERVRPAEQTTEASATDTAQVVLELELSSR